MSLLVWSLVVALVICAGMIFGWPGAIAAVCLLVLWIISS
jgi:hypothetical protein